MAEEEKNYYIAFSYTAEAEPMISSYVNKTVATEEKVVDGVHHQQHRSDELRYLSHSWLWCFGRGQGDSPLRQSHADQSTKVEEDRHEGEDGTGYVEGVCQWELPIPRSE